MKDRKLAVRYARALLSVLTDPSEASSADAFLQATARAWDDTPAFRRLLLDPAYSNDERRRALLGMAERAGSPAALRNFLRTVVDNGRAAVLPSIARVYHEALEERMGIVPAVLTSATPLDAAARERAKQAMQRTTGREVRLSYEVDPSLLGGAVTRVGSTIYDGSLRTQLRQLRCEMTQE